jgi:hypothetical protein
MIRTHRLFAFDEIWVDGHTGPFMIAATVEMRGQYRCGQRKCVVSAGADSSTPFHP